MLATRIAGILLILLMLMSVVPVFAVGESGDELPLGLMLYKYRRMMAWEREWAAHPFAIMKDNERLDWVKLAGRYNIRWLNLTSRMPVMPMEVLNRTYMIISEEDMEFMPSEAHRYYSYRNAQLFCTSLGFHTHFWYNSMLTNVSSYLYTYALWAEDAQGNGNFIESWGGEPLLLFYFYEHVPALIHEGDAYASWCLPQAALHSVFARNMITVLSYDKRGVVMTYPSLAFNPVGPTWFLAYADMKLSFSQSSSLTSIADDALWRAIDWVGLTEEELQRRLLIQQLVMTYYPIYNDLSIDKNKRDWQSGWATVPEDDSLIITLFPMSLEHAQWIGTEFEGFHYNRGYSPYSFQPGLTRGTPIRAKDYAPIYSLYTNDVPPGEGVYNVTIWIEGPALLVPAAPSTNYDQFIPNGVNVKRIEPGQTFLMDLLLQDPSIIRYGNSSYLLQFVSQLNNSILIPSNLKRVLGGYYPFIIPVGEPATIATFSVDLSKPWEAMIKSTFMVYFDPHLLQASPASYAILHIDIEGEGKHYHRIIYVEPGDPVFQYTETWQHFEAGSSISYRIDFDMPNLYINTMKKEISHYEYIEGEITFTRNMSIGARAILKRYIYNAKDYIFQTGYTVHDKIEGTLTAYEGREYEEWVGGNPYRFKWDIVYNAYIPVSYKYDFQGFNGLMIIMGSNHLEALYEPIWFHTDLSFNMSYEVIMGGVSPFPNAALPYWIPSAPSATIPPGFTPTAKQIFEWSNPYTSLPNGTILPTKTNLPGPLEPQGNYLALYRALGDFTLYDARLYDEPLMHDLIWTNILALHFSDPDYQYILRSIRITPDMSNLPSVEKKPDWLYEFFHSLNPLRPPKGYTTFIPAVIRSVSLTSVERTSPIPSFVRLGDYYYDYIVIPDVIGNVALNLSGDRPISPTTITVMAHWNIPAILSIISLEKPVPYESSDVNELFVISQFPTFHMYDLTLPFVAQTGRRPLRLNTTDYGWNDETNKSYLNRTAGGSWYSYKIPQWAIGFGLTAEMYQRGKLTGFYPLQVYGARGFNYISSILFPAEKYRFTPVDSALIPETDKIRIPYPPILGYGTHYDNPLWIPLGDGRQLFPVFVQHIHVAPREFQLTYSSLMTRKVPDKMYEPGESFNLTVALVGFDHDYVKLYYKTIGFPLVLNETPQTLHLKSDADGTVKRGSIELHIMNRSKIMEKLKEAGLEKTSIVKNIIIVSTPDNSTWRAVIIQVAVSPGLIISLNDVPLTRLVRQNMIVPGPPADLATLYITAKNITINLRGNNTSKTYVFNETSPGFNEMRFRILDPDLETGTYNATITITAYVPTSSLIETLVQFARTFNTTPFKARILYWGMVHKYPDMFRRVNITLRLENVRYDPNNTETVNISYPYTDTLIAIAILSRASGQNGCPLTISTPLTWFRTNSLPTAEYVDSQIRLIERIVPTIDQDNSTTRIISQAGPIRHLERMKQDLGEQNVCYRPSGYDAPIYTPQASIVYQKLLEILEQGITAPVQGEPYEDGNGASLLAVIAMVNAFYYGIPSQIILPYSYMEAYSLVGAMLALSSLTSVQSEWGPASLYRPNLFDLAKKLNGISIIDPVRASSIFRQRIMEPFHADPATAGLLSRSIVDLGNYTEVLSVSYMASAITVWNSITPTGISAVQAKQKIVSLYQWYPIVYTHIAITAYEQTILDSIPEVLDQVLSLQTPPEKAALLISGLAREGILNVDMLSNNLTAYTWLAAEYIGVAAPYGGPARNITPNSKYTPLFEHKLLIKDYDPVRDNASEILSRLQNIPYMPGTPYITGDGTLHDYNYTSRLALCSVEGMVLQATKPLVLDFIKLADAAMAMRLSEMMLGAGGLMVAGAIETLVNPAGGVIFPSNMLDWVVLDDDNIMQLTQSHYTGYLYGQDTILAKINGIPPYTLTPSIMFDSNIYGGVSTAGIVARIQQNYVNNTILPLELREKIQGTLEILAHGGLGYGAFAAEYQLRKFGAPWSDVTPVGYGIDQLLVWGYQLSETRKTIEGFLRLAREMAVASNTTGDPLFYANYTLATMLLSAGDSFLLAYEKYSGAALGGELVSKYMIMSLSHSVRVYYLLAFYIAIYLVKTYTPGMPPGFNYTLHIKIEEDRMNLPVKIYKYPDYSPVITASVMSIYNETANRTIPTLNIWLENLEENSTYAIIGFGGDWASRTVRLKYGTMKYTIETVRTSDLRILEGAFQGTGEGMVSLEWRPTGGDHFVFYIHTTDRDIIVPGVAVDQVNLYSFWYYEFNITATYVQNCTRVPVKILYVGSRDVVNNTDILDASIDLATDFPTMDTIYLFINIELLWWLDTPSRTPFSITLSLDKTGLEKITRDLLHYWSLDAANYTLLFNRSPQVKVYSNSNPNAKGVYTVTAAYTAENLYYFITSNGMPTDINITIAIMLAEKNKNTVQSIILDPRKNMTQAKVGNHTITVNSESPVYIEYNKTDPSKIGIKTVSTAQIQIPEKLGKPQEITILNNNITISVPTTQYDPINKTYILTLNPGSYILTLNTTEPTPQIPQQPVTPGNETTVPPSNTTTHTSRPTDTGTIPIGTTTPQETTSPGEKEGRPYWIAIPLILVALATLIVIRKQYFKQH